MLLFTVISCSQSGTLKIKKPILEEKHPHLYRIDSAVYFQENFRETENYVPYRLEGTGYTDYILKNDSLLPCDYIRNFDKMLDTFKIEGFSAEDLFDTFGVYDSITRNFNLNNYMFSQNNVNDKKTEMYLYKATNEQVLFKSNYGGISEKGLHYDRAEWYYSRYKFE